MEDPGELHRLGLAEAARGNAAMAIALQRHALRCAPDRADAAAALAAALAAVRDGAAAHEQFRAAVALAPSIDEHHHDVGALQPFASIDAVTAMLAAVVAGDPSHARAHAALGNIATRRGDRAAAMRAYALAVLLDWEDADLHLGLAQLYDTAGQTRDGARHLREALARKVHYRSAAASAERRLLLIKTPGGFLANALIEFCIDLERTNVDAFYVTDAAEELPTIDDATVAYGAIGESEAHAPTIARAIALADAAPRRVLNHPRALRNVRRDRLAAGLEAIAGAGAVPTIRCSRADPVTFVFPLVIRPVDTHRGDGLERIDEPAGIAAYVGRHPAEHYFVTPFVDYRSPDGYYRKYRVIVVDGVPYPYHLGISEHWLVHYWRVDGLMREHAWMRAEEERFLRDPEAVFAAWSRVFGEIAGAVGLDYFGVDCTLLADGTVLVFECDPSAFVHCGDDATGLFAYKRAYVPRIFDALDGLLERNRYPRPLQDPEEN